VAVYTDLGSETLGGLIAEFDVGTLISAKGIAEGVSNSNWLIETSGRSGVTQRFILTMYEKRVEVADLPFFLGLLDHLAARGCSVPRTIHDRGDAAFRMLGDKAIALIEFLPGVSVGSPTPAQGFSVGAALARIHLAGADFGVARANDLERAGWRELAQNCGFSGLESVATGLAGQVAAALDDVDAHWPADLPEGVIHADLFPDNVLMLGDRVTGLIDFYFACNDSYAYDLAVTHAAWSFDASGASCDTAIGRALVEGYQSQRPLLPAECAALPVLARGASLRFLLTRAWDWMHTPAGALVTRKDPLAFARRLERYRQSDAAGLFFADPAAK
jgi:homoserine kinase type II